VQILILGLPITANNLDRIQRRGIGACCKNISSADRAAMITNGTLSNGQAATITNLKTLYSDQVSDIDAQALNFLSIFSTSNPPNTQDWYIGCASLSDNQWSRIQASLAALPGTLKYGLFDTDMKLLETNTSLTLGNTFTPLGALLSLGLRPYAA